MKTENWRQEYQLNAYHKLAKTSILPTRMQQTPALRKMSTDLLWKMGWLTIPKQSLPAFIPIAIRPALFSPPRLCEPIALMNGRFNFLLMKIGAYPLVRHAWQLYNPSAPIRLHSNEMVSQPRAQGSPLNDSAVLSSQNFTMTNLWWHFKLSH